VDNSYAYDSHVELVSLLHKGFLAHIYSPTDSPEESLRNPKDYNLLIELRQAREAMDTRFAVGEDVWMDWLNDEIMLATSSEERVALVELFEKAVENEPASVRLWQLLIEWLYSNYAACNDLDGADHSNWTEEDMEVCREFFTKDFLMNFLEKGLAATQFRLDASHLLWNRYAELLQRSISEPATDADVKRLFDVFADRLQTPHVAWDETAQAFWPVVSRYRPNEWEGIMGEVNEMSGAAKRSAGLREEQELLVQRAIDSGDKAATFAAFNQYLEWERKLVRKPKQQGPYDGQLRCALFERALLRFPAYAEWWLDYADYATTTNSATSILPLLKRATDHCPWSGDLWARQILQSDVEGKSRDDIEKIKHRATNSGLLDVGGMEEVVKVLIQWCSFLRRHAFRPNCTEDDLDTAEVGITMALEDVQQAGTKIYGSEFKGDPLYRLERIQIKFLGEARRLEDARKIYANLVPKQKQSAEFWMTYHNWELWLWVFERIQDKHRVETVENGPTRATAVAQQALAQRNLDEPEKVLSFYLNHFQQHESGERLRAALVDAREFTKYLSIRRAKEAEEAAALQAGFQAAEAQVVEEYATSTGEKRKRDDENLPNGHSDKKSKTEDGTRQPTASNEPSASASAQIKRDRENNTITLKNLPSDTQDLDVKKFFRDIGAPLSISILKDNIGDSAIAIVEFEDHEDVLAAKTRNGKDLNGNEVRIQGGSQSTLYVTNYPPEYDETAMRKLFDGYGEVVSVRFPSLKFDGRRRFCYVQFLTSDMAKAAETALDHKMLDGAHRLVAKISDPDAKKQRSGAQAEGRELYVKNIERSAPDHEIKKFFEQYGTVVSMNIMKLVGGKRTGAAFVVFSSPDEATAALGANNKPFRDRILHVELSSSKGRVAPLERARKEDVIIKQGASASPEPDGANGRRGSDVSMSTSNYGPQDEEWKTARERKVAIFNLPDTVNDARIQSAMEKHGPLKKIQMRRQDNGAIVEFATVQDAFNVRQGVDCSSLGPDVRTGDVADLLAKAKRRQGEAAPAKSTNTMAPPSLTRPAQRGGRRGGLGFKRGGATGSGRGNGEVEGSSGGGAKSNADFRSMFQKGKESAAEEKEGDD
jgi:RNA recognition motif-containing protein